MSSSARLKFNGKSELPTIMVANGNDPFHSKAIGDYLKQEAAAFGTQLQPGSIDSLMAAIAMRRVQVLFIAVGTDVAGCAVQYPTAIPRWSRKHKTFRIHPAVYSEDMSVSPEISARYKAHYGAGLGTAFMQQRVDIAASVKDGRGFDLDSKIRARALVGEQSWHQNTAMGGVLAKFATEMPNSERNAVLSFSNPASIKKTGRAPGRIELRSLHGTDRFGNLVDRPDMFVVTWRYHDRERVAATFTRAFSTFTGKTTVRAHMASNGSLESEATSSAAMMEMLSTARAEIQKRGWIRDIPDPLKRTYVHALNEDQIDNALRQIGARNRQLGDYLMYPLVMDFENIPGSMGTYSSSGAGVLLPVDLEGNGVRRRTSREHEAPAAHSVRGRASAGFRRTVTAAANGLSAGFALVL